MSDIFDYIVLYCLSVFLAALKITAFISWSWWIVASPTILGLSMWIIVSIMAG